MIKILTLFQRQIGAMSLTEIFLEEENFIVVLYWITLMQRFLYFQILVIFKGLGVGMFQVHYLLLVRTQEHQMRAF